MITSSREETLILLKAFGVELPPKTTLTTDVLEKRLRKAMDCAQYITDAIDEDWVDGDNGKSSKMLDVDSIKPWSNGNVLAATQRGTLGEAMANHRKTLAGGTLEPELFVNPLMDLRQTVGSIAMHFDGGATMFCLQDQAGQSAIMIRVVEVLERYKEVPVIVVLYIHGTRQAQKGVDWIQHQMSRGSGKLGNVTATVLEQQLMLRLLEMNAKRLPPSYKPKRGPKEESFKLSFILPVGPLESKDLGKLSLNDGCVVCGKQGDKRCANCAAIYYCSADCQKYDWPQHKSVCKTLKGAKWTTIRIHAVLPGMYYAIINKNDHLVGRPPNKRAFVPQDGSLEVPPNTHGTRPFLLKVQSKPDGTPMIFTDRKRTLKVLYPRSVTDKEEAAKYDELAGVVRMGGGERWKGIKMFCWARRKDDWHIELALDRLPDQNITW